MPDWHLPPKALVLNHDEVHVWRAALDLPVSHLLHLRQTLDAGELARVRRLQFQDDRDHYIAAHGMRRSILAQYLGAEPQALQFARGPQGKPYLMTAAGQDAIDFNLSHSRGLALLAVARGREVGVDVEYIRAEVATEPLAEHFFSPREVTALRELPEHLQARAFFNAWTRKEAYLKARGEGLTLPLDQFSVSLAPGEPAELLWVEGHDQEPGRWSLRHLEPELGFVGALVAEGRDWKLTCWQWIHS